MRPALEVADIFRRHGEAFRRRHDGHLGWVERRVMAAIETCRTPALGGHAEQCGDCGLLRCAYNSCRNRHCPKCQGLARAEWLEALRGIEWVVYAKPPFAGPEPVLAYLGRYTHRVAIANSRLTRRADGQVDFTWKDYRHHGKTKTMTLAADEFIRRFLLHTVPDGFHRIRHPASSPMATAPASWHSAAPCSQPRRPNRRRPRATVSATAS